MANLTTNYKLTKPLAEEFYDIGVFNANADIIDGALSDMRSSQTLVVGKAGVHKNCDYLCDGVDDQVEINAAIAALPSTGGKIVLLEGTYTINNNIGCITLNKANVTISGMGNSTRLVGSGMSATTQVITVTADHCAITKIYMTSATDGIVLAGNYNRISDYTFASDNRGVICGGSKNIITNCICIAGTLWCTGTSNTISNNVITSTSTSTGGINLQGASYSTITGNTCNGCKIGIMLSSSTYNNISNNSCSYGGTYTASMYTIFLYSTANNYNLISSNMLFGKDVTSGGGTGNTLVNNKIS